MDSTSEDLRQLVESAHKIVIIVANNPDADAVGSALALEEILSQMQKEVSLYCRVEIPVYLHFLTGWDRINSILITDYDLAIVVDNSSKTLLQADNNPNIIDTLKLKKLVILDHHATESDIDFADVIINQPQMVATGQLIYTLAQILNWPLNKQSGIYLVASILSDSLGFSSQNMINNSQPLRIVADLVDLGVDLSELAQRRLAYQHIPAHIIDYKGQLLQRIEFYDNNQIACLTIDHEEIKQYSALFNPTIILDEMKIVDNVKISLGFKQYNNVQGNLIRITLRIRCHHQCQIAEKLATNFGGGGHPYAAGVKWEGSNLDFNEIKRQVLDIAMSLLKKE